MHIVNDRQRALMAWLIEKLGLPGDPDTVNTQSLIETALGTVQRDGVDKLISYLAGSDFYRAPASTRFHGNYAGALAEHSLNVTALLMQKNEQLALGIPQESCLLAGLCHDLCKVNFYTVDYRNQKVYAPNGSKSDQKGRFDWQTVPVFVIEDAFPCGHGEKSVIMLQNFMRLTQEEILMIRWHMGPFSSSTNDYDFSNAVDFKPEIVALFTADMEASALFEETRH